ncbi:hypothetical protein CR513_33507, partial [Mucuna pruriens]
MAYDQVDKERKLQLQELEELHPEKRVQSQPESALAQFHIETHSRSNTTAGRGGEHLAERNRSIEKSTLRVIAGIPDQQRPTQTEV